MIVGNKIKNQMIQKKVDEIMKFGVRGKTRQPLSESNPRQPVSQKRAESIANAMFKEAQKKNNLLKFKHSH